MYVVIIIDSDNVSLCFGIIILEMPTHVNKPTVQLVNSILSAFHN